LPVQLSNILTLQHDDQALITCLNNYDVPYICSQLKWTSRSIDFVHVLSHFA